MISAFDTNNPTVAYSPGLVSDGLERGVEGTSVAAVGQDSEVLHDSPRIRNAEKGERLGTPFREPSTSVINLTCVERAEIRIEAYVRGARMPSRPSKR